PGPAGAAGPPPPRRGDHGPPAQQDGNEKSRPAPPASHERTHERTRGPGVGVHQRPDPSIVHLDHPNRSERLDQGSVSNTARAYPFALRVTVFCRPKSGSLTV